jgi:hypothetical protein
LQKWISLRPHKLNAAATDYAVPREMIMVPKLTLCLVSALFATPCAAAAPNIDNEHVTVWDAPLSAGETAPATPRDLDSVTVFLEGGSIRTRHPDGSETTATRAFGDATFTPRGSEATDTLLAGQAREIIIGLKDSIAAPAMSASNYPSAFPRHGAEKMFENNRVIVWRFCWVPNQPVAMHFHDKNTVQVFRYDGVLRATDASGKVTPIHFRKGQINFSKAGLIHTETLVEGEECAVMTELK